MKKCWARKDSFTDAVVRKMELAYQQFMHADVKELTKESGCRKPCKYRKYRLIGDPQVLILEVYWAQWRVHLIQFSSPCLQPANLPKSLLFRPLPTTHWFVLERNRTLTIYRYIHSNQFRWKLKNWFTPGSLFWLNLGEPLVFSSASPLWLFGILSILS